MVDNAAGAGKQAGSMGSEGVKDVEVRFLSVMCTLP